MGPLQNAMQYEKVKTFFEGVTPDQLSLTNGGFDSRNQATLFARKSSTGQLKTRPSRRPSSSVPSSRSSRGRTRVMLLPARTGRGWVPAHQSGRMILMRQQGLQSSCRPGQCGSIHIWSLVRARYLVNTRREWDWL
jgi:hypothetical protein